jgi:hypothetical protein
MTSEDDYSFCSSDALSERSLFFAEEYQDEAPSQQQIVSLNGKMDRLIAMLSENGKQAHFSMELAQANEHLPKLLLQEESSLHQQNGQPVAKTTSDLSMSHLLTEQNIPEQPFALVHQERDRLKQSVVMLEQEKSLLSMKLIHLKELFAEFKLELADAKKDDAAAVQELKETIRTLTTKLGARHYYYYSLEEQPYFWRSSKNACVSGFTNSPRLELLECPPMTRGGGIYKWSILVEEDFFSSFELGVVSSTVHKQLDERLLVGDQGWGYFGQGVAYENGSRVANQSCKLPKLQKGSKVTLLLDLTGEGTLRASVDGSRTFSLFSDMLTKVDSNDHHENNTINIEGGFLPAVTLMKPTRVRFLGFEIVSAEDTKLNVTERMGALLEKTTETVKQGFDDCLDLKMHLARINRWI